MTAYHVFDLADLGKLDFDALPKGDMLKLAINPYTGYVFLKLGKHELSSAVALDIMRRVVAGCDYLEKKGSNDPLRDYARMSESGEFLQVVADDVNKCLSLLRKGLSDERNESSEHDLLAS